MAVIVFDMGGTLMEYKGMPYAWTEYYPQGFKQIAAACGYEVSEAEIEESVSIMKQFNPRIRYREKDLAWEHLENSRKSQKNQWLHGTIGCLLHQFNFGWSLDMARKCGNEMSFALL